MKSRFSIIISILAIILSVLSFIVPSYSAAGFWGGVSRSQLESINEGYGADMVGNAVRRVETLSDLQALEIPEYARCVYVAGRTAPGDGYQGNFCFDSADKSADVSADTQSGITAAPTSGHSVNPGDAGAWVRQWSDAINMKWFGPNVSAGWLTALDVLDNGNADQTGGEIYLPEGTFNFSGEAVVSFVNTTRLRGIRIRGADKQATILDFSNASAGENGIEIQGGYHVTVENLTISGAPNDGLAFLGAQSGYGTYSQMNINNVKVTGSGNHNFYFERGHTISLQNCFSKSAGYYGFYFAGYHTSLSLDMCYSDAATVDGFRINDVTYSSLISCASDNSGQSGYNITCVDTLTLIGCGAESSQRNGFYIIAGDGSNAASIIVDNIKSLTLKGCYAYNNNLSAGGYSSYNVLQAGSASVSMTLDNSSDKTPNGASLIVSGSDAIVKLKDCNLVGSVSPISNGKVIFGDNSVLTGVSVTAANTPVLSLVNLFGSSSDYSGLVSVHARYNDPSTSPVNSAGYVLFVGEHASGSGVVEIASNGLTSGGGASHPSFTWDIDAANDHLEASPVSLTSGTFYFYIQATGTMGVSPI